MKVINYTNGTYQTCDKSISFLAKQFPSLIFYRHFFPILFKASRRAKRGHYDSNDWCDMCFDLMQALEKVGVRIEITGVEHIRHTQEACVFIANHVSMIETAMLPLIIQPIKDVTFVVKQSLLEYPVFRHIMRSRNPIAVNRQNPRDDLKAVLNGGIERLQAGISVVIFPQASRSETFDPDRFNTIGIKLAQKAGAPVVPIALLTHALKNGKYIKDLGKLAPSRTVHFAFGSPFRVQSRGQQEHQQVVEFIQSKLRQWETT